MNRKKVLISLFILSIFLASSIPIHAEKFENKSEDIRKSTIMIKSDYPDIIVNKNGNGEYTSIQKAIDNAPISSTIYVKEGTYSEIIHIYKKIILLGENKEKTHINPKSQENGYAIKISTPGVILRGFNISNTGPGLYTTGIKIIAPLTTVDTCNVFDTPVGIAVWSSKNTFSNCIFWGCDDEGIAFLGSPSVDCNDNLVSNCVFFNNCDGIELQYSSNNRIYNSEFYENTHAGIDFISTGNHNNTISNCNIYNNDAFGIYLSHSHENIIENSTFSENKIMASNAKENIISNCNLDTVYVIDDSFLIFKNCKNFSESHIKVSSSTYEIHENSDNVLKNPERSIRYRLIEKIITFFNTIRLRLKSIVNNF